MRLQFCSRQNGILQFVIRGRVQAVCTNRVSRMHRSCPRACSFREARCIGPRLPKETGSWSPKYPSEWWQFSEKILRWKSQLVHEFFISVFALDLF